MSADVESLAAALEALAYKLEQEIRSPKLSVTSEYVAALDREHKLKADDIATYPERCRQQRHHDVLCLVLKAFYDRMPAVTPADTISYIELTDQFAKRAANLAYPPTNVIPQSNWAYAAQPPCPHTWCKKPGCTGDHEVSGPHEAT